MNYLKLSLVLLAVVLSVNSTPIEPAPAGRPCNDGLGVCTTSERCDQTQFAFTDGASVLNVRFGEDNSEPCHYFEVCCEPENVISDEIIVSTPWNPLVQLTNESQVIQPSSNSSSQSPSRVDENAGAGVDNDDNTPETPKNPRGTVIETTPGGCNSATHECIAQNFCQDGHDYGNTTIHSRLATEDCTVSSHVCCEKAKNIYRFVPSECGISNKNGVAFHVTNNVDESQFGEFPWVAALLQKSDSDDSYNYFCAGSLIHPNVVLTAAHCVNGKDISILSVRLGEWDTQTTNEPLPYTERGVAEIEIHENFTSKNLINDFALVRLSSEVPLSAHINTVCLPPSNVKFDGDQCFGTGWGQDNFFSNAYRANLKKVDVPVVPLADCQSKLRQTKLGENFKLSNTFMCAGGEAGKDTCTGDGGAPLVCPNPQKENGFYQAGIVAWGVECGQENVPGVYANVAKARQWIDGKMNYYGFGSESYTPKL